MTMSERASRQTFLGEHSEQVLADAKVAIVGLCGGGSHVAQQLAHVGVGHFVLLDDDRVEDPNLNRMIGSRPEHARNHDLKAEVIYDLILRINPQANVVVLPTKWEQHHLHLRTCTTVFGCVDSFLARDQLERYCRRYLLPYIDIGMDVAKVEDCFSISGQVVISVPGGPCMRCVGFLSDAIITAEVKRYGAAGARPQVIWPNGVLASTAVGIFVQMLTPWRSNPKLVPYIEYDGNLNILRPSRLAEATSTNGCTHFSGFDDLGDRPWQRLTQSGRITKMKRTNGNS